MMINIKLVDILEVGSEYTKNLPLALVIGSLFIYELFSIIPVSVNNVSLLSLPLYLVNYINKLLFGSNSYSLANADITINPYVPETVFSSFTQIESLGQGLYTYGAMLLILCSIILLLSMLAPISIVLSNPRQTTKAEVK
jgi:NADH-ubiquinone oxidoreductase chain 6